MIESIINLDKQVFYFINVGLSNPITDFAMPIITNGRIWLPIYISLFIYLIFFNHLKSDEYLSRNNQLNYFKDLLQYNKNGFMIAGLVAISAILADQISAHLIKDLVGRHRPCQELQNIHLLVSCGSGKSFPSAHSTNNFAATVILSHFFKNKRFIFYSISSIVALSRVFVGVHYPIDILTGAILGSLISIFLLYVYKKVEMAKKLNIKSTTK